MRRTLIAALSAATLLAGVVPTMAQDLQAPPAVSTVSAFAPLLPLIGRTWRGVNVGNAEVLDVARWDWAVGGHAVRVVHSVNDGAYGGETLIFPDKDSGELIFHYFTTGGFHTTGTMRPLGDGVIEIEEAVHGADGIESLRSRATYGADGTYRTRALVERDGAWVEFGGFDYASAPDAVVRLPMRAGLETASD